MRALAIVLLLCSTAAAQQSPSSKETTSDDDPKRDNSALRHEIDELRARQRWLEQRLNAADAQRQNDTRQNEPRAPSKQPLLVPPPPLPPPPDESLPRFRFGRGGFAFSSADGKTEIRVRGVLNLDGRVYVGGDQPLPDTFVIRRARPFIEGTLWDKIDFRLMPDFAFGQAAILDAYVDLRPWRWLRLRGGRFMIPVGLEWMQKDTTIHFLERSLATDLVPYRDLGLMVFGDFGDGTFTYQLAFVNGAPDSGNGPDLDPQSGKDYVGRLFLRPLRRVGRAAAITDLGFGVGASYGSSKGSASAPALPTYKSTGQQTIFTFISANPTVPAAASTIATVADGDRWRVSPQLYWYIGPVGVLAEYVISTQRVERLGTVADLQNHAWNVTLSFVVTMERATYDGVVPNHPVDFRSKGFGALELVLRYSELRFDDAAFPDFADPTTSVHGARELAGGINWHLTEYLKVMISFHRTDFAGGAATGDREPENALMSRLQLAL